MRRSDIPRARPALAAALLATAALAPLPAAAQKAGGVMKMYHRDSPPSASIHEEATNSTVIPFMGVFNNLVMFDQQVAQNSMKSIVPDLAESWSWDEAGTALTFKLRSGVKWHDGKPFTAADVKCTWDLLQGKTKEKLRKNPREPWYVNLVETTTNGDLEAVFHLKRPQPSFLVLLASGYSPVYPCHVSPSVMRTKPIGTGPFKVAEFKQNEIVRLVRNPDYWKPGRPYLDGIEFQAVKNRSTAILSFVAGQFDIVYPWEVTIPLLKDIKSQAPQAVCETTSLNNSVNLILNREAAPFDNAELRQAMLLNIDRKSFADILTEGNADIGGTMEPAPDGVWGLPPEILRTVAGYDGEVAKNREAARAIMRKLGYGPENRLKLKVATRNISIYRDPAVIFADQLKEIYIDAELDIIETANWYGKVARKDYSVGLNTTGNGVDDPDQNFYENFACNSERNYTQYCNKDLEKLVDEQSAERDPEKRKKLVWEIDRRLLEDGARPIIMWNKSATCWHPYVKGYVSTVNSVYNSFRFEDIWLDR